MESEPWGKHWKLELRYGRRSTPYQPFLVLADGVVGELAEGLECRPGPAIMSMRTWASSPEEASEMICAIGRDLGFRVTRNPVIYDDENPERPPRDVPYGYGAKFYPFEPKRKSQGPD